MSEASSTPEDLTGRSRLVRNVAFAWGGQLVHVVAGFIMPRLISDRLGQSTLGVWDFSWSVVSYFGLVQLGLSGSVQRYVPLYRSRGDVQGLNRSVSTLGLFLNLAGWLALLLAAITALWIVPMFQPRLGSEISTVRWVVFILGAQVAVSLMLTVYSGVIVGCHRWDIQNSLNAGTYALITVGMIVTLGLGGGLVCLALVYCLASSAGELARWAIARRVCPELKVDYRRACWKTWLEQARYSAKSLVPRVASLLSNQAVSILITTFLGPAMLAIYSRPRNLVSQIQSLAARFGYVLIPTASSLQARAEAAVLRTTFRDSTLFISALFLPGAVALAILGDRIIRLWMGDAYVYPGLVPLLVLGSFPGWVQEPSWSILAGMNRHGGVALVRLAGGICSAGLLALGLGVLRCDLLGAALAFAIPQALVDGLVVPAMACERLGVPWRHYLWSAYAKPLLGVCPFAVLLTVGERSLDRSIWIGLGWGAAAGLLLTTTYWCIVIPGAIRRKLTARLLPAWA